MAAYQELKGFRDLKVYQLAYKLAMEIYDESKPFPKDERFSLTDQLLRSSRSVAANIAEEFRKRQYPKMFGTMMSMPEKFMPRSQRLNNCTLPSTFRFLKLTTQVIVYTYSSYS